jgi:hypothetical protein
VVELSCATTEIRQSDAVLEVAAKVRAVTLCPTPMLPR